jgi:peptidoglycan/LPS O-acetylase OafA/YrhL
MEKSGWWRERGGLLTLDNWHAKPVAGRNLLQGLDGIRGIAILLVVSAHTIPFVYMDTGFKRALCIVSVNGGIGVWLFFVLSGFLISLPFFKRVKATGAWCPPGYVKRRVAKVIPPLYVSIILFTIYHIWDLHSWAPLRGALETMLFFEIFQMPNPLVAVIYWSLAAEVSFYILLPFLFWFLRTQLRRMPQIIPLLLIGTAAGTWISVIDHPDMVKNYPLIRDVLFSFVFFGWGGLFACFYLAYPKISDSVSSFCVLAGFAGFALCCWANAQFFLVHKTYLDGPILHLVISNALGASAALMLFVSYGTQSLICRLFSIPLLSLAGLISYEWYLFHDLFIILSNMITGSNLKGSYGKLFVRIIFAFPVAFIFSAAFYRYFSLPILRRAHQSKV